MSARADLSQFLIHLTKNGTFDVYNPSGIGYIRAGQTVLAKNSLEHIIRNLKIEARSPFGYFKLKINKQNYNNGGVNPNDLKSVCFSETPLSEIKTFYVATIAKRNQYQKYGLGFWQEAIRAKGANPISYIDSRKKNYLSTLNLMLTNLNGFKDLLHLFETFGPTVFGNGTSDFRWEREWRKKDDLIFKFQDVAFGICPMSEIRYFENLSGSNIIFIDADWSPTILKLYLKLKRSQLASHF